MPMMTGRRALMEMLKLEGVEYIFGNPGTSESPFVAELEHHPELKYLLVMQEGVAMGMADGYARATRKPAFLSLHIETGLGNAISLLHNAKEGGTPLVLTSVNKDIRELAQGRTDVAEMPKIFTKWSAEVTHPEQVPSAMRRAFNEARTPPTGSAYVGFSTNSLDHEADVDIVTSADGYFRLAPDSRAIEDAARILATAERPTMVIGDRVAQSGASNEAVRVAELLGARVYGSIFSEMSFPMSHPQFDSVVRLGFQNIKDQISKGDVVLMVGKISNYAYLFSDPLQLYFGPNTKLLHIDADPSEVGKSQPTEVGVIADPKVALHELAEALETGMSGSAKEAAKGRAAVLASQKAAAREAWGRQVKDRWDHRPMSDERMVSEIASALPENVTFVADSNTARPAVNQVFQVDRPDSFFTQRGGAIGWGMGSALGLKLAQPDNPVVAFVGDGSAMMTVQALWTAATENIPVVYVISNNASYRVLKIGLDTYRKQILKDESTQSQYIGMDFPDPLNLAGLAEAMGVYGRRIEDPTELAPQVRYALELGKPALLDVVVDPSW